MDGYMIRIQTIDGAINYEGNAVMAKRTERFIRIPMPWKRKIFSIKADEVGWYRPVLGIYWYKPSANSSGVIIRIGWSCA